jgi:dihydrofolate reductase
LQACNHNKNTSKSAEDPFYQQIDHSFPEIKTELIGYVNKAKGEINHVIIDPTHDYLITANLDLSIQLYSDGGDTLLSSIGRKGKGPGEFLAISQLYVGNDHALYVLDAKLKRITKFKIENQQLKYVTTFIIKPPAHMQIRAIYATKYGNFGVFHRIDNYKTHDGSFHLYRLDGYFDPVKQLLELPGDQKIKADKYFFIPWLLGRNTYWALKTKWFYYISSKSSKINMFNIITGQLKTQQFFNLSNRPNTKKTKEFLKERKAPLINEFPSVEDAIRKTKLLPIFSNFHVSGNRIFLNVYYAGGKGGRIICVNRRTEHVKVIKTSSVIWRFSVGANILYGIVTTSKKSQQIKIIKLL